MLIVLLVICLLTIKVRSNSIFPPKYIYNNKRDSNLFLVCAFLILFFVSLVIVHDKLQSNRIVGQGG